MTRELHQFIYGKRSTLPRPVGGLVAAFRDRHSERPEVYDLLDYLSQMALIEISGGHVTTVTKPPKEQAPK